MANITIFLISNADKVHFNKLSFTDYLLSKNMYLKKVCFFYNELLIIKTISLWIVRYCLILHAKNKKITK